MQLCTFGIFCLIQRIFTWCCICSIRLDTTVLHTRWRNRKDETDRTRFAFQTVYGLMLLLVETYNISREVQKSYWCALQIQSDITPHSPVHKTDVCNISKLRSSVYTSLKTRAVQHIDIITRPKEISIFRLGGWPSDLIRDNLTTDTIQTCLLPGFSAGSAPQEDAFEWGVWSAEKI